MSDNILSLNQTAVYYEVWPKKITAIEKDAETSISEFKGSVR